MFVKLTKESKFIPFIADLINFIQSIFLVFRYTFIGGKIPKMEKVRISEKLKQNITIIPGNATTVYHLDHNFPQN